jgi:hypothetical protein
VTGQETKAKTPSAQHHSLSQTTTSPEQKTPAPPEQQICNKHERNSTGNKQYRNFLSTNPLTQI